MKNEQGFTLIEVVASLAIIAIILISFSSIFIQSSDHANLNSQKLVATNLADAYLERLKIENKFLQCTAPETCLGNTILREVALNNNSYPVEIKIVSDTENSMKLQNIVVTVRTPDERASAVVEGYIAYE